MYLATSTRSDIAISASMLSQYNAEYDIEHWNLAKKLLRYLKGTTNHGLIFKKTEEKLTACVDADWGGGLNDRISYTGYIFKLAGAAISWKTL